MNSEELLKMMEDKYEVISQEQEVLEEELEILRKEKDNLNYEDKFNKYVEWETILYNGKSLKGKIKSYWYLLGKGTEKITLTFLFVFSLMALLFLAVATPFTDYSLLIKIIFYIADVIGASFLLCSPIKDFKYINKINKKYTLEGIYQEHKNMAEKYNKIIKELGIKEDLFKNKENELDELETTMENITKYLNAPSVLTSVQEIDLNREIKEEGKKLKLERK